MTERERLIELLWCASREYSEYTNDMHEMGLSVDESYEEYAADYLLKDGVMCPSYKVGDAVYVIADKLYWEAKVCSVWYRKSNHKEDDLVCVEYGDGEIKSYYGREIYFSKEEAEQALKGGADNGL